MPQLLFHLHLMRRTNLKDPCSGSNNDRTSEWCSELHTARQDILHRLKFVFFKRNKPVKLLFWGSAAGGGGRRNCVRCGRCGALGAGVKHLLRIPALDAELAPRPHVKNQLLKYSCSNNLRYCMISHPSRIHLFVHSCSQL